MILASDYASTRASRTTSLTKHQRYYRKNQAELKAKSRVRMAQRRQAKGCKAKRTAASKAVFNSDGSPSDSGFESVISSWGSTGIASISSTSVDSLPLSRLAIEDEGNRLPPSLTQNDYFRETTHLVQEWLAEWGGLERWNAHLDSGFHEAKAVGNIDGWAERVLLHAHRGRLLAGILNQMELNIPPEMWRIRELWRQQVVLTGQVYRALTIIEVCVDVVHLHSPFNLLNQDTFRG
ncbi:hypothetical protein BDN72DRAFT_864597 [Pluteus cervinus]|uniref:Uncharacterized protein n=1 Tax=Pluteus cervinus TaxID=181527 RepID=A0ACD3A410_9AGAR|nr:hypothetical protein BDN72DRAFT_864597 [Pluteus cervinus]